MRWRRVLTILVVAIGGGAALPSCTPGPGACPPDAGLRDLVDAGGMEIGTAYRVDYSDGDDCYEPVAVAEFNSLTPEIATFPNRIAAVPGQYDFAEADAICDLAAANDMRCQAHAIVWDPVDHPEWGIMPAWIAAQPPAQRRATMIAYIDAVARHFAGRVSLYTLVNEAFDSNGNVVANRWNTTGDDSYIFDAFRTARLADPTAKLFYNDFGAEDLNPKSDAILALAQRLRAETVSVEIDGVVQDVPLIDGVGMQMHVGIRPGEAPDPASVAANIARLGQAGLLVRITEMDVRIPVDDEGNATAEDLERQKQLYAQLLAACLDAPNCDGVSFWGHTDAHSWITENPGSFPGLGAAHPLDEEYRRKPAYDAIVEALTEG